MLVIELPVVPSTTIQLWLEFHRVLPCEGDIVVPKERLSVCRIRVEVAARVSELKVEASASVQLNAATLKELPIAPEPLSAFAPVPLSDPVPVSVPEFRVTGLARATALTSSVAEDWTVALPEPRAEV